MKALALSLALLATATSAQAFELTVRHSSGSTTSTRTGSSQHEYTGASAYVERSDVSATGDNGSSAVSRDTLGYEQFSGGSRSETSSASTSTFTESSIFTR